eukprot:c14456_g1_i2 orf=346-825(-)
MILLLLFPSPTIFILFQVPVKNIRKNLIIIAAHFAVTSGAQKILFTDVSCTEIKNLYFASAVLLWLLTAACIKTGRPQIARRAVELIECRLSKDNWPEYYDGKHGRFVGKQARKFQTWSIAGYLVAKMLLEDPSHLGMIALEEDKWMKPALARSASWTC